MKMWDVSAVVVLLLEVIDGKVGPAPPQLSWYLLRYLPVFVFMFDI